MLQISVLILVSMIASSCSFNLSDLKRSIQPTLKKAVTFGIAASALISVSFPNAAMSAIGEGNYMYIFSRILTSCIVLLYALSIACYIKLTTYEKIIAQNIRPYIINLIFLFLLLQVIYLMDQWHLVNS